MLKDLTACAGSLDANNRLINSDPEEGTSYEIFGWYAGSTVFPDGTLVNMDLKTVNEWLDLHPGDVGYNPANDLATSATTNVPKRVGHFRGMSTTVIVLDSDQDLEQSSFAKPSSNWPDANNNHGTAGLNMGFADGHVAFIPRGPQIITTYLKAYSGTGMLMSFINQVIPTLHISYGTGTAGTSSATPNRWYYGS